MKKIVASLIFAAMLVSFRGMTSRFPPEPVTLSCIREISL